MSPLPRLLKATSPWQRIHTKAMWRVFVFTVFCFTGNWAVSPLWQATQSSARGQSLHRGDSGVHTVAPGP